MKKIINLILLLFLGILSVNAQNNNYYYYKGEKIYLTLDKSRLNITTITNFQKSTTLFSDIKNFDLILDSSNGINSKFGKIEFQTQPNDSTYYQKINSLKSGLYNILCKWESIDLNSEH